MEKTYRFRIEPNAKQQQLIIQNFGCCRFVFNYYLNNRIINYQMTGETFNIAARKKSSILYEVGGG